MPYDRWNEEAETWSEMRWIGVKELGEAIRVCQSINFSVVEQRREALAVLNSLYGESPFNRLEEFPQYKTYVCLMLGSWPVKMSQAIEALNFKETTLPEKGKEAAMKSVVAKYEGNDPRRGFYSGDDALHAFHQALVNMQREVAMRDRVYGRRSLEDHLNIEWH
jgi:hypothetical protein